MKRNTRKFASVSSKPARLGRARIPRIREKLDRARRDHPERLAGEPESPDATSKSSRTREGHSVELEFSSLSGPGRVDTHLSLPHEGGELRDFRHVSKIGLDSIERRRQGPAL